jgi:hypothetical protein
MFGELWPTVNIGQIYQTLGGWSGRDWSGRRR